jgi:2-polyprenyl-6-methoxyphenol hydroxylase-like FAD-dependent oxidoreductase
VAADPSSSSGSGTLTPDPIDVLVVGAGPVGLALALQAHAHGACVQVVERRRTAFRPSRAMILHPRTLECLNPLGVTDTLLARAARSSQIRIHLDSREHAVQLDSFGLANTRFARPLLVRQSDLEAVLAEALAEQGVVVQRGIALESFSQDGHLVRARVCGEDGAAEVRTQYLAGCDGANSNVRALAGIGWSGGQYRSEVVLADVELSSPALPELVHVVVAAAGLIFLFPLGEHATWRLLATRNAAPTDALLGMFGPPVPIAELQALLSRTRWPIRLAEVAWSSRIRLPHRLADRFRTERVFLVGDAAHAHSPAGGQGMNTGLQDALNLGWKLAFASRVSAAAAEELLGSYEQERRAVDRRILGLTRLLFWAEAGVGPLPRLLRSRLTPLAAMGRSWVPHPDSIGRAAVYVLAQFWVSYRRSPLSTDLRARPCQLRAGDRLPDAQVDCNGRRVRLHDLTARPGLHVLLARDAEAVPSDPPSQWLHIHRLDSWPGTGLVIIRPDGYLGFRATSVDRWEVAAWLARVPVGSPWDPNPA